MKYKLENIVGIEKKTVNPQKTPNVFYSVYSLPGFDNNKTPEELNGKNILSNKIVINKDNYILFNKLNLRFKRVWYFENDGKNNICSTEFLPLYNIRPDIVNSVFLYYSLINDDFYKFLIGYNSGTSNSHQRIHKEDLLSKIINLPNLETQQKIVHILATFDRKIEINDNMNLKLKEYCHAYYSYLIRKDSTIVSLSKLMHHQGGSQPPASNFQKQKNSNNIRFIQIRDFDTDSHICYIPNSPKNKKCKEDDILIARYGASLGRICYGLAGAYNVALAKVIPTKSIYKELLRVVLESNNFFTYLNQVGQRSAQAGFNTGDLAGYTVKMPKEEDLVLFNNIAETIIKKRLLLLKQNLRLKQTRDLLISKLMSGEIDLSTKHIK